MPHKIPDEDTVSSAIASVMARSPHVDTQAELLRLVRKELSKAGAGYRVSGERVRRVGVERGVLSISIEYRESDAEGLPHICPVCRNAMSPVMNRSLDGEHVEIKRRCTLCPYTVGKDMLAPGRYSFSRPKGAGASPQDVSLRKLRKAAARVREAAGLIAEAVEGTDLQDEGADLASRLMEVIDSEEGGIKGISAGIERAGPSPIVPKKP
ncbi:MAG: hypothetical protein FWH47_07635 [Methanomassiliicoccaceae archaeon]|nr:hypothetical protein [Methanomassiliicoccaceae archaeon]